MDMSARNVRFFWTAPLIITNKQTNLESTTFLLFPVHVLDQLGGVDLLLLLTALTQGGEPGQHFTLKTKQYKYKLSFKVFKTTHLLIFINPVYYRALPSCICPPVLEIRSFIHTINVRITCLLIV